MSVYFFVKNKEERFLGEHMYPIGLARQAKKKTKNKRSLLLQASCLQRQSTNNYSHATRGEIPPLLFSSLN